jgi:hypothetical protein
MRKERTKEQEQKANARLKTKIQKMERASERYDVAIRTLMKTGEAREKEVRDALARLREADDTKLQLAKAQQVVGQLYLSWMEEHDRANKTKA